MFTYLLKLAYHDADADTDILAMMFAGMSARKSGRISRHRHPREDFRWDIGVSGESARILARKSVSVSTSWNASLTISATCMWHDAKTIRKAPLRVRP